MVTDTVLRRFRPDVVHIVVHYDPTRFQGLLDGWANAVRTGLVEGGLRFDGTKVIPISPRPGRGLLRAEAERRMQLMLSSGSRHDLELPIGNVTPLVDQASVDAAAARTRTPLTGSHGVVDACTL